MIFLRNFKSREKILLCILAVLLLAAFYLFSVHFPVSNAVASAEEEKLSLENELLRLEIMQVRYDKMNESLDNLGTEPNVSTPQYDNLLPLMNFLHKALATAKEFDISFNAITEDENGKIIRRDIGMTFTADSYKQAREIVDSLSECPYRCTISDLQIIPADGKKQGTATIESEKVTVTMSVTFYEMRTD